MGPNGRRIRLGAAATSKSPRAVTKTHASSARGRADYTRWEHAECAEGLHQHAEYARWGRRLLEGARPTVAQRPPVTTDRTSPGTSHCPLCALFPGGDAPRLDKSYRGHLARSYHEARTKLSPPHPLPLNGSYYWVHLKDQRRCLCRDIHVCDAAP